MASKDKPDYMSGAPMIGKNNLDRVRYNDARSRLQASSRAMQRSIDQSGAGPAAVLANLNLFNKEAEGLAKIDAQEKRQNAEIQHKEEKMNQYTDMVNAKNFMAVDEFNRAADAATKDRKLGAVQSGVQALAGIGRDFLQYKAQDKLAQAISGETGTYDRAKLKDLYNTMDDDYRNNVSWDQFQDIHANQGGGNIYNINYGAGQEQQTAKMGGYKKLYKKGGTKIDQSIAAMEKSYKGNAAGESYERDIKLFEKAYGKEATNKLINNLTGGDNIKPDSEGRIKLGNFSYNRSDLAQYPGLKKFKTEDKYTYPQQDSVYKAMSDKYMDIYERENKMFTEDPSIKDRQGVLYDKNVAKKDRDAWRKKYKSVISLSNTIGDVGKQSWNSREYTPSEAFAEARNMGLQFYYYDGKKKSTRYKEETPEEFKRSFIKGTPEYEARERDRQRRNRITWGPLKDVTERDQVFEYGNIHRITPTYEGKNEYLKELYGPEIEPNMGIYKNPTFGPSDKFGKITRKNNREYFPSTYRKGGKKSKRKKLTKKY